MFTTALLFSAIVTALPPPTSAKATDRWPGNSQAFEAQVTATKRAFFTSKPSAMAQLYRLLNTAQLTRQSQALQSVLVSLSTLKQLDPLLLDHVHHALANLHLRVSDPEKSRDHIRHLGLATDGWLVGPFENAGNSGHGTTYPPESQFELKQSFQGKGLRVAWRRIQGLAPQGQIRLSHLLTPNTNASAYTLFAVRANRGTRAALRIAASDQIKVFYDGHLVYEFDGKRRAALDQISIPLYIKRGAHRILVKSSWGHADAKIMLRITRPQGGLPTGIEVDGDIATIKASFTQKTKPSNATHSIHKPEDSINAAIKKARKTKRADLLGLRSDLFTLLSLFDRRTLPSPAQVDLQEAIQLKPSDPRLRFYYAIRSQSQNRPLARKQLQAALVCDPGHSPSLLKLADIASDAKKRFEARRKLEQLLKSDPGFAIAHTVLAKLRFSNPFEKESGYFALQEQCQKYKNAHCLSTLSRLAIKLDDLDKGQEFGDQALALDPNNHRLRFTLAQLAFRTQNHQRLDSLFEQAMILWPYRSSYYYKQAQYLRGRGQIKEAITLLEHATQNFPGEIRFLDLRSELALAERQPQEAIHWLKRALLIDPSRTNIRRKHEQLKGQKDGIETLVNEDIEVLSQQTIFDAEQEYGAIYLVDKQVIELFPSGQSSRVHQYAIRLHKKGIGKLIASQRIYFTPGRERVEILAAERITAKGEVIPADRITESGPSGKVSGTYVDQRWKWIQFKKLQAQDTIHIRYRVDSVGPNIFGEFFGDISNVQSRWPKRNISRTILAPKHRRLYTVQLRAPAPKRSERDKRQKIQWAFDQLDGLEREPSAPPYADRAVVLAVSSYPNWNELGAWYSTLIGDQFELDDAARKAGRAQVKDIDDEAEKIRRLYAYVVKNTRYVGIELGIHGWKPFKAAETHQRRYGDCKDKATLLAALLRDNGIDATLALVRTSDRGHLPEDHASMWAFNHAITYVPSGDLFLDGTAEFSGTRELPYMDQDGQALIVWPDGRTEKRRIPQSPAEANRQDSEYEARISDSGQLHLQAKERFEGAFAPQTRRANEAPERRKIALETRLASSLPGIKVVSSEFLHLDELETSPIIQYEAKLSRFGRKLGNEIVIPLSLFDAKFQQTLAPIPKRTLDLQFSYPWSSTSRLRFILPAGRQFLDHPQNKTIENPYIRLEQTFEETKDGLTVINHITLKQKRIPVEDYPEFRKACAEIDRTLKQRLRISF